MAGFGAFERLFGLRNLSVPGGVGTETNPFDAEVTGGNGVRIGEFLDIAVAIGIFTMSHANFQLGCTHSTNVNTLILQQLLRNLLHQCLNRSDEL